jgi:hypothetical protein
LWWLLFPSSVIKVYQWLYKGKSSAAKPSAIRIAGVLWIALVLILTLQQLKR